MFGIQVTYAKEHRIAKTAYVQLYKLFELDPQVDAMAIYIVSSSENAESYAKKGPVPSIKRLDQLNHCRN